MSSRPKFADAPVAKRMIEAFEGCDYVAVNAAGCGSSMKDYGDLLSDDEEWRNGRRGSRTRCGTFPSCWPTPIPSPPHPVPLKIAYHDGCHLAHARKVRSEPRQLLRGIPELELVEPAEWEICCGSAGIYNLVQPDAGRALGQRKAENLLATVPTPSRRETRAARCRSPPTCGSTGGPCRSSTLSSCSTGPSVGPAGPDPALQASVLSGGGPASGSSFGRSSAIGSAFGLCRCACSSVGCSGSTTAFSGKGGRAATCP